MGSNVQKLGNILSSRMTRTAGAAVPTTLELGTINRNLSLTTDSLRTAIPRGSYMVNLALKSADSRPVKGGDRVLVAWCGNEPVVVAVVVGS